MRYDGGKGVVYPHIINLMPPHWRYIETHLGGGAVMRHKRPAEVQVAIEIDRAVIESHGPTLNRVCEVIEADAVEWLEQANLDEGTLVYADPPYHPETRRRRRVYRHDYTEEDHERLLEILLGLPTMVMISGYACPLYEDRLRTWNRHTFLAKTHVGMRRECVWFNYPRPIHLHDYRYLGETFREREVIRRRQARLKERLLRLSATERASIHAWLGQHVEEGAGG